MMSYSFYFGVLVPCLAFAIIAVRYVVGRRATKAERASMAAIAALPRASTNATFRPVPIYVNGRKIGELMASTIAVTIAGTSITGKVCVPSTDMSLDVFEAVTVSHDPLRVDMMIAGKLRRCVGKFTEVVVESTWKTGDCTATFSFVGDTLRSDGAIPSPNLRPHADLARAMSAASN